MHDPDEPTQPTKNDGAPPLRKPEANDDVSPEMVKPARDGPQEVEDAARQESEYPSDETDEGASG
jgi:hypothetical protein